MAKLVSKTYGDALFETVMEQNRLDDALEEVQAMQQVFTENPELVKLMNHPNIVKEEKCKMLENIFKGHVSDELIALLQMLVNKDHFSEVDSVLWYFIYRAREQKGIGTAKIVTATELTEEQKKAVEKRLLETTDYNAFEFQYELDPSLIAGMKIRIGDRVVDSSIRTKLEELKKELSKVQITA
jgi:F-type H+-transporting ATPase subunit delta